MEIIIGKTSGFCAGVKNAVANAEKEIQKTNQKIHCLGELVHNKQVIQKLEKEGLETIENIEQAIGKTIIRAHGVSKQIYEKAKKRKIQLIDLTCPKVLKIHKIAEEYKKKNYFIILVGVENHPESIGTISFCGENSFMIRDKDDIEQAYQKLKQTNLKNVLIIAQTTYNMKKFDEIVELIKKITGEQYNIEVKNTICTATKLRQEETEKISKEVDCMIIVGGKNSSNTKKLYDIAKLNCPKVELVETINDVDLKEIDKNDKIGIMAGASTPNESVEQIKNAIMKQETGGKNETEYSISRA